MDSKSVNSFPTHIYLDCTATINNGLNTGIQRVVRKLLQNASAVSDKIGIPIIPVVFFDGQFQRIKLENNSSLANLSQKYASEEKLRLVYFKIKVWLGSKSKNNLQALLKSAFKLFAAMIELVKKILLFYFNNKRVQKFKSVVEPINFKATDVLVLADSWWAYGVAEGARILRQQTGTKVVTLIYDFIPVSHPELTAEHTTQDFAQNLSVIAQASDAYIGISKFVQNEITKYIPNAKFVDYFYLGGDFAPKIENENSYIRPWPHPIQNGQFYLVVSTIEPRKGHDFILDAFENHWKMGGQAVLCMVGRIGSGVDDLANRILHHSEKGKKLFNYFNVNDLELQDLYAKSKALIFASKIEGFGLPLVEAMEKGRPILASDIPVFREICGEYAQFFSLEDSGHLTQLLQKDPEHKNPVQWITWYQSAEMFYSRIIEAYRH